MDPISIAMGLASFVPDIVKWISGSDKAADAAQKVVSIAQQVTGTSSGDDALAAVRGNPTLALQLQQELDRHSEQLNQISQAVQLAEIQADTADTAAVNATMQAEAKSDHWPTYSWRPFIGFCFGLLALISGITVAACYLGVMFGGENPQVLAQLPGMIGAEAGVMATMAPVLGIASWFRGKMQADPRVQTDNRG
ncbi:3TM-type holin [Chromobacterium subtsugae]|uniref:3TM-type holin n=1 Tax=Chromobacterium subtsugae TaxID=251747 RepID=UPI0009B5B530|nr:3TM-type holin [Chromobacterium subtsugae]